MMDRKDYDYDPDAPLLIRELQMIQFYFRGGLKTILIYGTLCCACSAMWSGIKGCGRAVIGAAQKAATPAYENMQDHLEYTPHDPSDDEPIDLDTGRWM